MLQALASSRLLGIKNNPGFSVCVYTLKPCSESLRMHNHVVLLNDVAKDIIQSILSIDALFIIFLLGIIGKDILITTIIVLKFS